MFCLIEVSLVIFLTNLTLLKKITLLTTIGLVVVIGIFSFLDMRAVHRATETLLEDRLTTAHNGDLYSKHSKPFTEKY